MRPATLLAPLLAGVLGSCGDQWIPGALPHTRDFPLVCAHATTACESCHPADRPIAALDPQWLICMLASCFSGPPVKIEHLDYPAYFPASRCLRQAVVPI